MGISPDWMSVCSSVCCMSRCRVREVPQQLLHMGVCNEISGAHRTSHRRRGDLIRGERLFLEAYDGENSQDHHSNNTQPNQKSEMTDPGVTSWVSLCLAVHTHNGWLIILAKCSSAVARFLYRGVWCRWRARWWAWRCHIDGLVLSLLAPAIRSAAQETAACLLRNADARLTYRL